jgi:hypothetical protein
MQKSRRRYPCRCMQGNYYWLMMHGYMNEPNGKEVKCEDSIPLIRQNIDMRVENSVATIVFTQCYKNTLEQPIEATYMFPLDPDVVISDLTI